MLCPNCSYEIEDDSVTCIYCNYQIIVEENAPNDSAEVSENPGVSEEKKKGTPKRKLSLLEKKIRKANRLFNQGKISKKKYNALMKKFKAGQSVTR